MSTPRTAQRETPRRVRRAIPGTPHRTGGCHLPSIPFMATDMIAALAASVTVLLLFDRWFVLAVLPAAWILCLARRGAYEQHCLREGTQESRRVLRAAGLITVGASVAWWFAPEAGPLHDTLFALPVTVAATLLLRRARRSRLRSAWHHGRNLERAVVVGPASSAADLISLLRRNSDCGLVVVGVCLTDPAQADPVVPDGVPSYVGVDATAEAVRHGGCDAVIALPSPGLEARELRRLSWQLQEARVELLLAPVLADVAAPRLTVTPVAGLPLMELHAPALSRLPRIPKELTDRLFAAAGLLLLAPLMLILAALIRLDSPGPALFKHCRIGLRGEEFTLLKFRTMHQDAEQRKGELSALNQYGNGALFKIVDDPRVTRVGAFLRRWSLDELPQLLNVVAGRMSLVGPRPLPPDETIALPEDIRRLRLLVKPGLSGLWQVSGRSALPLEERMHLDLSYVENWSTALDLRILARTPGAVIRGTGAY
ncbi:sugar transferase [Streptomyces sp. YS415]|uniref:sugar transferase n=1 Tax=Streptomyces sp. YS415 TaxID=2944806 RepID=UPI00202001EB|nr:sugar transferase [Streptomyces sp. YS415]MCL7425874.1 sugar transferase [Streptomyces sp. YS415]